MAPALRPRKTTVYSAPLSPSLESPPAVKRKRKAKTAKSLKPQATAAGGWRPQPRQALVVAPTMSFLPPTPLKVRPIRQRDSRKRGHGHRARMWQLFAPTFRLDVSLETLQQRPKNTKALLEWAEAKMEQMSSLPADAGSARFVDRDGKTLVCVFANREDGLPGGISEYPGPEGRTLVNFQQPNGHYDGIPEHLVGYAEASVQYFHSVLQPVAATRDVRHLEEKVMEYGAEYEELKNWSFSRAPIAAAEEITPVAPADVDPQYERTGVTHLVHGWHQQGHKGPKDAIMPSKDMVRGSQAAMAARYYFEETSEIARYLATLFEAAFPEVYQKYKEAFEAGVWEKADPGPWLGRAIVYKLQVKPHVDGLDSGPTACWNHGNYAGGEIYRPGDVLILLSGILYHAVGKWLPVGTKDPKTGITPGRVAHVHFFPAASYAKLEGKAANWSSDTMGGRALKQESYKATR